MKPSEIHFYVSEPVQHSDRLIAKVPQGLDDRFKLLDSISSALHFPEYFGRNWDALEDFINDLRWVEQKEIILLHEDLPLKNSVSALKVYISIITDASKRWREDPIVIDGMNELLEHPRLHIFQVYFAEKYRPELQEIYFE